MIAENPDTVMEIIEDYAAGKGEEEEVKIDIDEKSYKAKIEFGKNNVEVAIKILRVRDDDVFCIDFVRKSGDYIEYLTLFEEIKEQINKKFGYLDEEEDEDQN